MKTYVAIFTLVFCGISFSAEPTPPATQPTVQRFFGPPAPEAERTYGPVDDLDNYVLPADN